MSINIVLLEPEIPQNTGNIVRTAHALGARLHLIEPLGFTIDEKSVRRAGLDYWDEVEIFTYSNIEDFYAKNSDAIIYYATTKSKSTYAEIQYSDNVYIMFGKESTGIDESILKANYDMTIRIPMLGDTRSLNLSNSVAIIAYEIARQHNFKSLNTQGNLTGKKQGK